MTSHNSKVASTISLVPSVGTRLGVAGTKSQPTLKNTGIKSNITF